MSEALATTNGTSRISTALAAPIASSGMGDIMQSAQAFEHMQRVAKMFASSFLIPEHLRGKVADVTIALAMARELGENPLVVMQSIYVVSGKAGWAATYMIARANRSGVFKGRIRWRESGTGANLVVTAYATLADTGEEVSVETSMQMAHAENWVKNPKYKSMPQQMLRYRSATMLIRLYAPEVMLGGRTSDEVEDLSYAGQDDVTPVAVPAGDLGDIIDADEPESASATLPEVAPAGKTGDAGDAEPAAAPEPQAAQPDAVPAEHDEPPADYIPDDLIGTVATFRNAMKAHAEAVEMPDDQFTELMKAVTVNTQVNNNRATIAMASRRAVLAAFRAGTLGMDGKIQQ